MQDFLNPNYDWQPLLESVPSLPLTDVLRLDKLGPVLSGNKPLKLAGFKTVLQPSHRALLSFGGVHSNHLHALAYQAKLWQLAAVLVVRGYATQPLSATLKDCCDWDAQLLFVDKKTYAKRYDLAFQTELAERYQALVVPEGGAGQLGEQGCVSLANLARHYDEVWLAVGSGATALGLAQGLSRWQARTQLVAVNAVADQGERQRAFALRMPQSVSWRLIESAQGFGKINSELRALIAHFDAQALPLEPVYTAKLMQAFLAHRPMLPLRRTLLIHTGGLQGRRGFEMAAAPKLG